MPAPGGAVAEKFSKLGIPTLAGKVRLSHLTHLALPAARIFPVFTVMVFFDPVKWVVERKL